MEHLCGSAVAVGMSNIAAASRAIDPVSAIATRRQRESRRTRGCAPRAGSGADHTDADDR
jgi:hypothetical protein